MGWSGIVGPNGVRPRGEHRPPLPLVTALSGLRAHVMLCQNHYDQNKSECVPVRTKYRLLPSIL